MQASDAQPETAERVSIILRMIMTSAPTIEPINIKNPANELIASGTVEKASMHSTEYLNSPQNDHFVFPATRSTFSNGSHSVLNPTHSKIPLEKRLYSDMARMLSTICRDIRR